MSEDKELASQSQPSPTPKSAGHEDGDWVELARAAGLEVLTRADIEFARTYDFRAGAPGVDDWRPIDSVPRDGQTVQLRQLPWAPFHGWYHGAELHPIQYHYSARPTHWRP